MSRADMVDQTGLIEAIEEPAWFSKLGAFVAPADSDFVAVDLESWHALSVWGATVEFFPSRAGGSSATDSNVAARGATLFAVRETVAEIFTGRSGRRSQILPLYFAGHWPFGLTKQMEILVL